MDVTAGRTFRFRPRCLPGLRGGESHELMWKSLFWVAYSQCTHYLRIHQWGERCSIPYVTNSMDCWVLVSLTGLSSLTSFTGGLVDLLVERVSMRREQGSLYRIVYIKIGRSMLNSQDKRNFSLLGAACYGMDAKAGQRSCRHS